MQADRGNNGSEPDPDWMKRLSTWEPEKIEGYIGSFASFGPLNRDQVVSLLQHLPPPAAGWGRMSYVLEEYLGAVQRWDMDVARGVVPANPKPNELAAWCDHFSIELPEAFVQGLQACCPEIAWVPQAVEPVPYPNWAPLGQPLPEKAPPKERRGRPKRSTFDRELVIEKGAEILLDAARAGEQLTIQRVALALWRSPENEFRDPKTICRILNGKLPWDLARQILAKFH
jgi:hypothetical protein